MKETSINWNENRNEIKNRVIEHLSLSYNLTGKDWEICLEAIDSVFFFEDELLEDNSQNETKSVPSENQSSHQKSDSSHSDTHSQIKNEIDKDYEVKK